MNEPTLTDTEREALWGHPNQMGYIAACERIVAARVADAIDRERAAWATKMADAWDEGFDVGDDYGYGCGKGFPARPDLNPYRALLAADDTETKP